jgi:hypothetical protein
VRLPLLTFVSTALSACADETISVMRPNTVGFSVTYNNSSKSLKYPTILPCGAVTTTLSYNPFPECWRLKERTTIADHVAWVQEWTKRNVDVTLVCNYITKTVIGLGVEFRLHLFKEGEFAVGEEIENRTGKLRYQE